MPCPWLRYDNNQEMWRNSSNFYFCIIYLFILAKVLAVSIFQSKLVSESHGVEYVANYTKADTFMNVSTLV